jgi:hypothetical protein
VESAYDRVWRRIHPDSALEVDLMDIAILAEGGQIGRGIVHLIGPVIATCALVTWLTFTIRASYRKQHPERRHDQSPHRGDTTAAQPWGYGGGGVYHYEPGMYSHSYEPNEVEYNDENR